MKVRCDILGSEELRSFARRVVRREGPIGSKELMGLIGDGA